MTVLTKITEQLITAPVGQLDAHWRGLAERHLKYKSDDNTLLQFFTDLYNADGTARSPFVATLVNPKFTAGYVGREDFPKEEKK